jgi:antirestriction protein ArdC
MQHTAQRIAESILTQLEQGVRPWVQPWSNPAGGALLPLRITGETYRGINVVLLWMAQAAEGYASPTWMTYRQAGQLGGQVRKGEKGSEVVYYGQADAKTDANEGGEAGDGGVYRFLKSYRVFNVAQIDGLPERFAAVAPTPMVDPIQRIGRLDAAFRRVGARIEEGGHKAYFEPSTDRVRLPRFELFRDEEQFYATLAHELAHWTGGKARLDRVFGKRFGDSAYAAEECVAELTAAFVGAVAGLRPDHIEDHANYIGFWIKAMKADASFILKCASLAQAAADYIIERARFDCEYTEAELADSLSLVAA